MDQETASVLSRELSPGEKLLWSGRPQGGIRLRKQDAFMIPFSLMWGGFAVFWEFGVFHTNAPLFMRLWGVPFVLIGLYLIFGRFIGDAMSRKKIIYGVTTQRILILSGFFTRNVRSFDLKALPELSLMEKSDGTGSIYFSSLAFPLSQFSGGGWPSRSLYLPAFEMIERARDVQAIIRRAQADIPK